jgi:hypothetical protein
MHRVTNIPLLSQITQRNIVHCKHYQLEQKYFLSHILVDTGWMTRVWFPLGARTFIFSLPSHLEWLGLILSPMLRVPGSLSSWMKWPKCEADSSSYMVVLRLRCTSIPPYVFVADGLIKFRTTLPLPYHTVIIITMILQYNYWKLCSPKLKNFSERCTISSQDHFCGMQNNITDLVFDTFKVHDLCLFFISEET